MMGISTQANYACHDKLLWLQAGGAGRLTLSRASGN